MLFALPSSVPVPVTALVGAGSTEQRVQQSFDAADYLRHAPLADLLILLDHGFMFDADQGSEGRRTVDSTVAWLTAQGNARNTAGVQAVLAFAEARPEEEGVQVLVDDLEALELLCLERTDVLVEHVLAQADAEASIADQEHGSQVAATLGFLDSVFVRRVIEPLTPIVGLHASVIQAVDGLLHLLTYHLGPGRYLATVRGSVHALLADAAGSRHRADLYRAAGVPAAEAWHTDHDLARRPSDTTLRGLAALSRPVIAP
jgi:hypothetical protein